ncbi:hypothetical protein EJ05DRAFT_100313 [Pseudovirgaria hyperparasitica]|uniref:Zn(2)-C6 fungal-type domain-containing protein n=1 Tax=Pseudovirgaria hyperparasitica TaxID=470096 RepID=A0A6A6W1F7_9PEZI|nr:uncharacterized protein EJ05DRAFT_100313 [Pseudovirgaria hyperparasitica]KAF2755407.1 hypothetical protein EJ05DRAFT_100313 [Pseudovirgaria hyperparasitica]
MVKGEQRPSLTLAKAGSRRPKTPASRPARKTDDDGSESPKFDRPKSRHRASVACVTCRDRRIRCVVPSDDTRCVQCSKTGVQCIIKNDDERRRPISRAYMSSLLDRISMLEQMLVDQGIVPPPANHPPQTRHHGPDELPSVTFSPHMPDSGSENTGDVEKTESFMRTDQFGSATQYMDMEHKAMAPASRDNTTMRHTAPGFPQAQPIPPRDGMVKKLLSTQGHLSFDQLNGRLRYFGPTTNCHVHSGSEVASRELKGFQEHEKRAAHIISLLPTATHAYLMELFWQHYNSVMHVVHQEAFTDDYKHGGRSFYSPYLHVCVLAMGYRFADKARPDMQRLVFARRQSTLHSAAKDMLDSELEQPGGVTSVVALLLLGDLECGVGRDNLGWMYSGMAIRLAFDIGLHLDSRASGFAEREVDIRQMTLWACVIYDKYWAMFLGRPTSMKSADLEIYYLAKQFERLGTCKPAGPGKSLETLIYEALLDLMELAGRISDRSHLHKESQTSLDRDAYSKMVKLDHELNKWYTRLPEPLKWNAENVARAPFSFFLLHQQYHSSLILLHRPFSQYEDDVQKKSGGPISRVAALSRSVCTKHAVCVSKIFWQHRQRFNTKQVCISALQHAGTAATALIAALAFMKDSTERGNNMQYLECIAAALQDMADTYQPAERMSVVLQAVVAELRGPPPDPPPPPPQDLVFSRPVRRDTTTTTTTTTSTSNTPNTNPTTTPTINPPTHTPPLTHDTFATAFAHQTQQTQQHPDPHIHPQTMTPTPPEDHDIIHHHHHNHPTYPIPNPNTPWKPSLALPIPPDSSPPPSSSAPAPRPALTQVLRLNPFAHAHAGFALSSPLVNVQANPTATATANMQTWMGAPAPSPAPNASASASASAAAAASTPLDIDPHELARLASVHFPEMSMSGAGDGGLEGKGGNGAVGGVGVGVGGGVGPYDYMNLDGSDWREW